MGEKRCIRQCHRVRVSFGILLWTWASLSLAVATAAPAARKSANQFLGHRFHPLPRFRPNSMELLRVRGGNADYSSADGYSAPPPNQDYQPPPPQDYRTPPGQQQPEYEYPTDVAPPNTGDNDTPFQETFQDRVDNWRKYQIEHAEEQRSSLSPRDEKGRMKLLASVGKGSRAITFFILMWRNVHLYEVVDSKYKGNLRFMGVLPLTFLFVANLAGVVASLTSAGHSAKKRLKAILNLNKLVEVFLILSHLGKLIFSTSNLVPREIYISQILHSVFFVLQCQTVTRFVWDETLPVASQTAGSYPPENENEPDGQFQQPPLAQQPIQSNPGHNQRPYRY